MFADQEFKSFLQRLCIAWKLAAEFLRPPTPTATSTTDTDARYLQQSSIAKLWVYVPRAHTYKLRKLMPRPSTYEYFFILPH